ncbi:DUF397 domain-containing protein [Streptomyces lichenis]|uniref:DUF397 domain-containing protein n=1 Tax=Streptomyces lichenis TaxID=2306967 RepID=A0ABT0I5M1_9ACTN|nr:DUF397 domain-containing protein [Streptomyces lichenis]MCK8676625.1 DUF397 domain-containing protein [Streptomyces lichenis]
MDSAALTGAPWRKSSHSNGQAQCVEVAVLPNGSVATRDSKAHGHGPALIFTTHQWQTFQTGVQHGVLGQV